MHVTRRPVAPFSRAILLAIMVSTVVAKSGVSIAQVSNEGQAQTRFQRGRDLFIARDFAGALVEFRAANQLLASPNTRLYVARCLRETGQVAEALVEFRRAAAEASDRAGSDPRYVSTRDAARTEGGALEPRVGQIHVRVIRAPAGTTIRIGDRPLADAAWNLPMPHDPGSVEVSASATGHIAFRRTVTIEAGRTTDVQVELPVDPNAPTAATDGANPNASSTVNGADAEPAGGRSSGTPRMVRVAEGGGVRWAGVVVSALGLGGLVTFGYFGSLAQNRYTDLQTACVLGPCIPELQSQVDEGERYGTIANVTLVVGIVAVGAGITMIAAGGPVSVERAAAHRRSAPASVWASAVRGGGSLLGVRGEF